MSPIVIACIWEVVSRNGIVDAQILPPPSAVFAELWRMTLSAELPADLWASVRRILAGFTIALFISVLIGAVMARSERIEDLLDPNIELIRPVSPLAIYPLALLWFGIGDASKVFLIGLSCSFPIILNTYAGVRAVDRSLIRVARSLGASRLEIFCRIVLKGALPQIFTGVRIAWGIGLIVIIAAEMIGGTSGLGFMVLTAQQTFRVDKVFGGIIVIGVLGFATDQALRALKNRLLPWHQEFRE